MPTHRILKAVVAAFLFLLSQPLSAQEFLDTAGRYTLLTIPVADSAANIARSIIADPRRILVGRENRSLLRGFDSATRWDEIGDRLPDGLSTVWALAHLDSAGSPDSYVAFATFGNGSATEAWVIATTDGGSTWSKGARIEAMEPYFRRPIDTMLMHGKPRLQFHPVAGGGGLVGYLTSGAGLWRSSDAGGSWERIDGIDEAYRIWMADAERGFGFVRRSGQIYVGDLAVTSDGWKTFRSVYRITDDQYRFPMGVAYRNGLYRALLPDRHKNLSRWRYWVSDSYGGLWEERSGNITPRPLWGEAFWLDTADVHIVGDGGTILHTPDGFGALHLLHDSTPSFTQSDLLNLVLVKGPVAAMDTTYIYAIGRGNRMIRWRYAEPGPRVVASIGNRRDAVGGDDRKGVVRVGDRVRLRGIDDGRFALVDLLGRRLATAAADGEIDLRGFPRGAYLVVIDGERRVTRRILIE